MLTTGTTLVYSKIVFTNDQYSGSATGSVSFDSFAGFTNLKGEANTADCALEIYVATT